MKQPLNEQFRRMQKLAGIITENKINEAEEISPEKAADMVAANISKIENSPKIEDIADKIANDPKATKELMALISKANISLNENVDINSADAEKLALMFAKKAETLPLKEDDDVGGAFWLGLIGGGTLSHYLASLGDVITPHMKLMGFSPSHMTASVLGAIAGAALLVIAKMIYDKKSN
jgi:hypothetical protein